MESIQLGNTGPFGILILVGASQGYLLSTVFFLRSRGDAIANRLLGATILIITLHLSEIFLDVAGLLPRVPHLSAATFPLIFLIGPTFYLYLRRLAGPPLRPSPWWLLHLVPSALVFSMMLPWYATPAANKAAYHASRTWGGHAELDLRTYALLLVNVLQNAGYAFFGQRLIRARERTIGDTVADNAVVEALHSLRTIARAFSVYAAVYAVLYVALVVWGAYSAEVDTAWLVLVALFLQGVGYSAMNQPETFTHSLGVGEAEAALETARTVGEGDEVADSSDEARTPLKYAKAPLAPERARRIMDDLLRLFREERFHLNRELKLSDVAARLNVSAHNLSQAISREGSASFLELVNRHRIDEAKRMLADPRTSHLTILAIGFEAGFNNKASFNQAFKRFTDRTPSAFRREHAQG